MSTNTKTPRQWHVLSILCLLAIVFAVAPPSIQAGGGGSDGGGSDSGGKAGGDSSKGSGSSQGGNSGGSVGNDRGDSSNSNSGGKAGGDASKGGSSNTSADSDSASDDDGFFGGISRGFSAAIAAVSDVFGGVVDTAVSTFGGVVDTAVSTFDGVTDAIGGLFGAEDNDDTDKNGKANSTTGKGTPATSNSEFGVVGSNNDSNGSDRSITNSLPEPDLTINLQSVDVSGDDVTAQGFILNVGNKIALTPAKREKELVVQMDIDLDCDGQIDIQKPIDVPFVSLRNDGSKLTFRGSAKVEAGDHCLELDVDADDRIVESTERNNVSRQVEFTVERNTNADKSELADGNPDINVDVIDDSDDGISEFENDLSGSNLKQSKNIDLFVRALELGDSNELVPFEQRLFNPVTEYQTTNLTISPNQHVAIKYSSRGFSRCVTSFFNTDGATEADTFALGKDIAEPITGTTRTYIVRCLNDNVFEERSIAVTRQ